MRYSSTIGALLLLASGSLHANGLLQFDPFSRLPELLPTPPSEAEPAEETLQWSPQLMATVVAGSRSMANVSGRLIRLGQKLEGFTLVEVDKRSATFEKDGEQHVLKIKERKYTR